MLENPLKVGSELLPPAAIKSYVRARIHLNYYYSRLKYGVFSRPWKVYWIDPSEIQRSVRWIDPDGRRDTDRTYFDQPKYRIAGTVWEGDWESEYRVYEDSVLHQSFVEHFQDGVSWNETELFECVAEGIRAGESWWECTTVEQFRQRCDELDVLYESIAEEGYRTQYELSVKEDAPLIERQVGNGSRTTTIYGEIAVVLGPDGEVLFHDGRNRLSMAKILDLDAVPVVVLVHHPELLRSDAPNTPAQRSVLRSPPRREQRKE